MPSKWRVGAALFASGLLSACGGGGSPVGPTPPPTAPPGFSVAAVVYYDENSNGNVDPGEPIRIPDVEVAVGGRTARTEKRTGQAVVTGVAEGEQSASVRADTLPPFFRAGAAAPIRVPLGQGSTVFLPVTLDIGGNVPNVYMAFGDSITRGDGSQSGGGYPTPLETLLAAHFGGAQVNNRGADATNSYEARERLQRNLRGSEPAYTLIMYGTNDWHIQGCQQEPASCPTVENLRLVIQGVKGFDSLPFVATLPPVNPALQPPERNQWVAAVNAGIRTMAREEGAFLVDVQRAFERRPSLPPLFSDGVHPNDAGYQVIAEAFFEAIAHGRSE